MHKKQFKKKNSEITPFMPKMPDLSIKIPRITLIPANLAFARI